MPGDRDHPWELTLTELLALLERERGEQGRLAAPTIRRLAASIGLAFNEILETETLRSLLLQAGFPPEDLGLHLDCE